MITASICLSDIPKERIVEAKNGKKYLNFVVDERREVGQYGDTHTVYLSQSKEERENKEKKVFVGSGKEWKFEERTAPAKETAEPAEESGGLPF